MTQPHGDMTAHMAAVTAEEIEKHRAALAQHGHAATEYEIRLHIARSKINPRRIAAYEESLRPAAAVEKTISDNGELKAALLKGAIDPTKTALDKLKPEDVADTVGKEP